MVLFIFWVQHGNDAPASSLSMNLPDKAIRIILYSFVLTTYCKITNTDTAMNATILVVVMTYSNDDGY